MENQNPKPQTAPIKEELDLFADVPDTTTEHIAQPENNESKAKKVQSPASEATTVAPAKPQPRRKRGPVPTLGPTTGITLHLPSEIVDKLHAAALAYNCTIKALAQKAIEDMLKKAEKTHGPLKAGNERITNPSKIKL